MTDRLMTLQPWLLGAVRYCEVSRQRCCKNATMRVSSWLVVGLLGSSCATPNKFDPRDIDGGSDTSPADAPSDVSMTDVHSPVDTLAPDLVPDVAADTAACGDNAQCGAAHRCENAVCISRCPESPASNLVPNAGFDRTIWTGVDSERGNGPRVPKWDTLDSEGCPTSGSMVVNDRAAKGCLGRNGGADTQSADDSDPLRAHRVFWVR